MSTRQAEDALREQIAERMRHARFGPPIVERPRQLRDQPQLLIRRLEQDRAAIRAGVRLIERRDQWRVEQLGKENSLCYRLVVQRNRLRRGKKLVWQRLSTTRRRLCLYRTAFTDE